MTLLFSQINFQRSSRRKLLSQKSLTNYRKSVSLVKLGKLRILLTTKELSLSVIYFLLIYLETSFVRFPFNSDDFLKKVKEGDII